MISVIWAVPIEGTRTTADASESPEIPINFAIDCCMAGLRQEVNSLGHTARVLSLGRDLNGDGPA